MEANYTFDNLAPRLHFRNLGDAYFLPYVGSDPYMIFRISN